MDKEAQPSVCKGQPIRTKLGGWVKGRGVRTVDQVRGCTKAHYKTCEDCFKLWVAVGLSPKLKYDTRSPLITDFGWQKTPNIHLLYFYLLSKFLTFLHMVQMNSLKPLSRMPPWQQLTTVLVTDYQIPLKLKILLLFLLISPGINDNFCKPGGKILNLVYFFIKKFRWNMNRSIWRDEPKMNYDANVQLNRTFWCLKKIQACSIRQLFQWKTTPKLSRQTNIGERRESVKLYFGWRPKQNVPLDHLEELLKFWSAQKGRIGQIFLFTCLLMTYC